jgi:4-hydroxybenzoate polyprenyltransferase
VLRNIYHSIQSRLISTLLHKFSLLFTNIYVVLFLTNSSGKKILLSLVTSLILSLGVAGIGYLINDLHDLEKDIQQGKSNFFKHSHPWRKIILFGLFFSCAIFPWFSLPFDQWSLIIILLELILFTIYAMPPIRLKERGLWGVVTDAMYAHVLPCCLAVYTFSKVDNNLSLKTPLVILYIFWLLLMGCRNIFNHQIEDYENDLASGTKTIATDIGREKLSRIILLFFIPAEAGIFLAMLYFLPLPNYFILFVYIIYIIQYFIRKKKLQSLYRIYIDKKIDYSDDIYKFYNNNLLNEFYEIHMPLVLLIYFSFYQHFFIWIFIINFLAFFRLYMTFYLKKLEGQNIFSSGS